VEPKQTKRNKTGQNEDQQGQKRLITAKQCNNASFTSKVVINSLTKTPKLAVLLFRETTETNLFVSDSVNTNLGYSFDSVDMNRVF
jgi:hypothetical protein